MKETYLKPPVCLGSGLPGLAGELVHLRLDGVHPQLSKEPPASALGLSSLTTCEAAAGR